MTKRNAKDVGTGKRKAVLYARVSSQEQADEGYSIDAQTRLLHDYAEKNDINIVREFVEAETAKTAGRSKFGEMVTYLKKVRRGKDSKRMLILVEKVDRLYRNLKDRVTIGELDIELHLVKENTILSEDSKSSEKFIHDIKLVVAKNYIDNLREETTKGMREKARQGIWPTKAPFGYRNVTVGKRKCIEQDPTTGPMVEKLFSWYLEGMSLNEVKKRAKEEMHLLGFKSGVSRTRIHQILRDPLYIGKIRWDEEVFDGQHKPLVPVTLFRRTQARLAQTGKAKRGPKRGNWSFGGMLKCGHCGCLLTAEKKKGKYVYYHCTAFKGKCPEKYVREEKLAEAFCDALDLIRLDEDVVSLIVRALRQSHAEEIEFRERSIRALKQQDEKLKSRLDRMYEDRLDGLISKEFYLKKSSEYKDERKKIQERIAKHQAADQAYVDSGIKILELAESASWLARQQLEAGNYEEISRLAKTALSNSHWKDGELTPEFRKPFSILASMKRRVNGKREDFLLPHTNIKKWYPSRDSNPELWTLEIHASSN